MFEKHSPLYTDQIQDHTFNYAKPNGNGPSIADNKFLFALGCSDNILNDGSRGQKQTYFSSMNFDKIDICYCIDHSHVDSEYSNCNQ